MSAESTVLSTGSEGVAEITLNRPDRLNAFNEEMHRALFAALDEAERREDVRCVLLTGAGRGFCAGQDLGDRAVSPGDARPDLGETIGAFYNPLITKLHNLSVPVLCAVNGVAAGAGANIALACDIVLAARSAKFIQAFSKLGLVPDSGGTFVLPRMAGLARAMGLALTGEPLPAERAEAWGLIWRCVDDEALMSEARTMARGFAAGATRGYVLTRKAMRASFSNSLEVQLELERVTQQEAGFSEDYAEGVSAFMAKRPPNFTGR